MSTSPSDMKAATAAAQAKATSPPPAVASAATGMVPGAARTDDIVIGMGVTSSGKFTTAGLICVDGTLTDADVEAAALSISRGGEFHGRAVAERVEIFGTLCGEVVASEQIVLRASAVVMGKIAAPYIITHRGAAVSGEVKSLERRPEVQLPPSLQRANNRGLFKRVMTSPLLLVCALTLAAGSGAAFAWFAGKSESSSTVVTGPRVADAG